jgi:hypothetical protein
LGDRRVKPGDDDAETPPPTIMPGLDPGIALDGGALPPSRSALANPRIQGHSGSNADM